jgi:hypothetical protein
MKTTIWFLLLGLAPLLAGCSGGTASVEGNVTLDGAPLEDGVIRFEPADGKGPTAEAVITNGRYTIELSPGAKRVMIEGWRVVGQAPITPDDPQSPMHDVKEPMVPDRYGRNSELRYDVKGSDTEDFALTTQ